jgi:hypothetical protein
MTGAAFFPWMILAWLFGKRGAAAAPAAAAPAAAPTPAARPAAAPAAEAPKVVPISHTTAVQVQPPPWPQVVPAGLPAFPGSQWVPDNPPGAGVVARASALLPTLWAHGPGTFKTEQTAGRWITYRATPMGANNQIKGVVAFKLATEPSIRVGPAEVINPEVPPPATPGYAQAPGPTVKASAPKVALQTLRLRSPRMTGPDVVTLQQRLGLTADGVFGSGTHAAVVAYQQSHGLVPDGVVGSKTWASLFGSGRTA